MASFVWCCSQLFSSAPFFLSIYLSKPPSSAIDFRGPTEGLAVAGAADGTLDVRTGLGCAGAGGGAALDLLAPLTGTLTMLQSDCPSLLPAATCTVMAVDLK